MNETPDDELAERVAALEETLEELRAELEPQRGPFGLPRPPSPREVIRFTDQYAIPTAIAILEANVRTLQLLRAVLRGARGAPREDEVRDRATSLGRTTIERVDGALADLQTAIADADLPQNDEARSLLEEARGLNRELRDAIEDTESGDGSTGAANVRDDEMNGADTAGPLGGGVEEVDEGSTVEIDVDAELASIKDEMDERDDEGPGDDDGTNQSGVDDDDRNENED